MFGDRSRSSSLRGAQRQPSSGPRGAQRQRRPFNSQNRRFVPRAAQRPRGAAYIAPTRYVQAAQAMEQAVPYQASHEFIEFGLDERLVSNVQKHGYSKPTEIQDRAIPALVENRDVVGIANTGTGKTAAFLLPLLNKVLRDPNQGVLILAPTRELAVQIAHEFKAFALGLPVSHCLCIGGMNINPQINSLRRNPHFVIGTPGRIKDLIKRGTFDTALFTNIVLDEVDRMLDIGFRQDIKFLISKLPAKRHTAFFSATLNDETDAIARSFLNNPVTIQLRKEVTNQQIEQDVIKVRPGQNKFDILTDLLLQEEFKKVIVFGRTKHGINKIEQILVQRGLRVTSIHGNKSQGARQRSLQDFKFGHVQALLATDIASRGIDVENVTHVINYDEPQTYDDYIHRIGRTGRAGKVGKALTFVER